MNLIWRRQLEIIQHRSVDIPSQVRWPLWERWQCQPRSYGSKIRSIELIIKLTTSRLPVISISLFSASMSNFLASLQSEMQRLNSEMSSGVTFIRNHGVTNRGTQGICGFLQILEHFFVRQGQAVESLIHWNLYGKRRQWIGLTADAGLRNIGIADSVVLLSIRDRLQPRKI